MIYSDVEDLAKTICDGTQIAIPTSRSGVSMTVTRALISQKRRNLHLIAIPTTGLQADMLIGAGCVTIMESAGVTLDEQGQAPCFVRAVKTGTIKLKDSTCPAIISALQAGEKGIPFIPMRGLLGSDLLNFREDYQVIDNPYGENDPIVLLPAIVPDIALFHAPQADRHGNVWIGKNRELMTMAHAAKKTLVTVEEIIEGNLLEDELKAPATIPNLYISGVAAAKKGAWPLAQPYAYDSDEPHLENYVHQASTPDGFAEYLATNITLEDRNAAE